MITLENLLSSIEEAPNTIDFNDVIQVIQVSYTYQATEFQNGLGDDAVVKLAGSNEGSCKIFSFAKIHQLTELQTLACFGSFYRDDVLKNQNGGDHQNIRNFIKYGWAGILFSGMALN